MAREREFDPADALDRATALFWQQGYGETSMEDVVEATGVSRYGLYGTFGNKRELFIAALRHYATMLVGSAEHGLAHPGAGLPEIKAFLKELLERAEAMDGKGGCMICNTAIEVAPHDPEIAATIQGLYEELAGLLANAIRNAQNAGELGDSLDPDDVGQLLLGVIQGAAVFARTGTKRQQVENYMNSAMALLR